MKLPFTKMHGIGNDFVVVDYLSANAQADLPSEDAVEAASVHLCDRKFGIGGDGVLLVLHSTVADFKMRMFNPDGSEAEMCGNGVRCFAKFVRDRGYSDKSIVTVETGGGPVHLELAGTDDAGATLVKVDMGQPRLERADLPMTGTPGRVQGEAVEIDGETLSLTGVSMGNPHVIYFHETASDDRINRLGPQLEKHELFPRRTNVHEVEIVSPTEIKMLTWERGAGRTLACGTGACACAVAAAMNHLTGRRVLAHLPGGDLQIDWADDDHVYMTGAAVEVFTGVVEI